MGMKPPVHIWQCAQGHPVCQPCRNRPEVRHCPTCRQRIVGRATLVEKIAAQVFTEQDKARGSGGSGGEYTTQPETSPDTSPVSSPGIFLQESFHFKLIKAEPKISCFNLLNLTTP